jgi:hypothetical protein
VNGWVLNNSHFQQYSREETVQPTRSVGFVVDLVGIVGGKLAMSLARE